MPHVPAFDCAACRQRTSRLFGLVVYLDLDKTAPGTGTPAPTAVVLGYCQRHRDQVVPAYLEETSRRHTVRVVTDPPVELRPGDVDVFREWAEHALVEPVRAGDRSSVPTMCPHCGTGLGWDRGPHLEEARALEGARAWECSGCGAAGMLLPTG